MTLILSCLTQEYLLQVSDRRLTFPDGSVHDDDATKAVIFDQHTAFSYTGLAQLPRSQTVLTEKVTLSPGWIPTYEWLAEVLAATGMSDGRALAGETEAALQQAARKISNPQLRRVAFIAVSWAQVEGAASEQAVVIKVSNLDDPSIMRATYEPLEDRPFYLDSSLPLAGNLKTRLERDIAKCVGHKAGPAAVGRLLVEVVRAVASSGNETVGTGLLVNCIPLAARRSAVAGGSFTISASEPSLEGATFYYMPATGDNFVQHAPTFVLPRGNVIKNMVASAGSGAIHMEGTKPKP